MKDELMGEDLHNRQNDDDKELIKMDIKQLRHEKKALQGSKRYYDREKLQLQAEVSELKDQKAALTQKEPHRELKESHEDLMVLQKVYSKAFLDITTLVQAIVPTIQGGTVDTVEPEDFIPESPDPVTYEEEPDVLGQVVEALAPSLIEHGPAMIQKAVGAVMKEVVEPEDE